jgi:competence protein ComEC
VRRDRGNRLYRFAYGIRRHIEDRIRLRVDPDRAAVLIGVMFGTQTGIDPEVQRDFQVTGTIHILSASGLHVAVIAGVVSFLLTRLGLRRRWAAVLTILALIVYTIMAGLSPPIVRSAVMYTAYVGALVFGFWGRLGLWADPRRPHGRRRRRPRATRLESA